ncbi:Ribosomal RNA-processing protein 40 [Aphelenchoides bicaudatus]|nr:Ribosomal RNA-processing protein 40 [Aphelenchoides bicaudatus]
MATLLLPGDEVPAKWLETKKKLKVVGPGLKVHTGQTLIATVAGILNETETKIWVESAETRYIPRSGDFVLGTVTSQGADYYRVDVGGPQQAMLGVLNFEGATKRNKPNIKPGDLVYGQILLASKNMEPEMTCVDNDGRAQGMGYIKAKGPVMQMPLNFARRLLRPDNKLISELGKHLKFEIVVGMNGQILISANPQTVVTVHKVLERAFNTFESNYESLVENVLSNANVVPMEQD